MAPQILPFSFGDDPLNSDDVAAVQCMSLKGDLPIIISWFLNNEPITTIENGISVVMTSSRINQLTIESVTAHHRGIFKCIAQNKGGYAEYSAELRVNGTLMHISLYCISYLIIRFQFEFIATTHTFLLKFHLKSSRLHLVMML